MIALVPAARFLQPSSRFRAAMIGRHLLENFKEDICSKESYCLINNVDFVWKDVNAK
ncbi:unnamed protein product [Musa acuminata subsp. burmannicoides]